jgi:hypothetical protein
VCKEPRGRISTKNFSLYPKNAREFEYQGEILLCSFPDGFILMQSVYGKSGHKEMVVPIGVFLCVFVRFLAFELLHSGGAPVRLRSALFCSDACPKQIGPMPKNFGKSRGEMGWGFQIPSNLKHYYVYTSRAQNFDNICQQLVH